MEKQDNNYKSSLESSESRLKAILETAIDGIVTINDEGSIETVNPAVEKMFGYAKEELVGKNINILMPEPYASEHDAYLKNYLRTGEKKIIGIGREVEGKRKDGSVFHMGLAVSEMNIDGQRMFTGVVRDISRRKIAEGELLAKEQRIRTLVETIPDGILVIDENGIIETFNPAAERIFGYSSNELLGKTINTLMPASSSEILGGYLRQFLDTGNSQFLGTARELVGQRKDGTSFPMELTLSNMWLDGKRLFNGIVRDISDRKAAEIAEGKKHALEITAAFERTHSQVMTLFSTSYDADMIFQSMLNLLGEHHNFPVSAVYLSDEWQGLLKCVACHGLPDEFNRRISPDNGLLGQAVRSAKSIVITAEEDIPFKIDTGLFTITPNSVILSPIIYSDKVLGVLILAKTSELEKIELGFIERLTSQIGVSLHNLNQYHNMKILSDQLRQRGQEISHKNKLLEKANRLKTEFLANMSHELRTPLNAIIGFSEVLTDQVQGKLNELQADYINEILSSANHLLSLINDILDLSKVEAGKMDLYLEPINVLETFQNSLSVVKEQALSRKISLNLKLDDDVAEILLADTRKLKQILFNLLSNAVKFTMEGGSVSIEVRHVERSLEVRIIDTGIGIPENKISLLFSPFEQLDGSLARQYEGTGLGLALVKRLVELHGGEVGVKSVEGEGSCFYFTIPYKIPQGMQQEGQTNPSSIVSTKSFISEAEEGHKKHGGSSRFSKSKVVLIVEDNYVAAQSIASQLEQAGYANSICDNVDEALKLTKALQPDLLIVDILMPGVASLEFMSFLRSEPGIQDIPIFKVAVSTDPQKGINLGILDVLEMSDDKHHLIESVSRAVPSLKSDETKVLVVDEKAPLELMLAELEDSGYCALGAFDVMHAINLAYRENPDVIAINLLMPKSIGFDVLLSLRSSNQLKNIPVIILTHRNLSEEEKEQLYTHGMTLLEKYHFNYESLLEGVKRKLPINISLLSDHAKYKILIIEDDQQQADLLKQFLEDAGYQVNLAANGYEGIESLKRELPDLISLDLLMPEMDGFAFLEVKGSMPEYARIPVMVLSSVSEKMEDFPIVADAVLRKPIERADILSLIENVLPPVDKKEDSEKPKLLLIDDDPKAIKIISSYLPHENYEVMSAFNGTDGIELAKLEKPDLIILDLLMPEISGFDVLTALKKDSETSGIPVFILTAKVLSNEERLRLQTIVEAVAQKQHSSKELLVDEVGKILKRYKRI